MIVHLLILSHPGNYSSLSPSLPPLTHSHQVVWILLLKLFSSSVCKTQHSVCLGIFSELVWPPCLKSVPQIDSPPPKHTAGQINVLLKTFQWSSYLTVFKIMSHIFLLFSPVPHIHPPLQPSCTNIPTNTMPFMCLSHHSLPHPCWDYFSSLESIATPYLRITF